MRQATITGLCARVGMRRQNYYARRRHRDRRRVDEGLVVELVRRERRVQPRVGGRKLLYMLRDEFQENDVDIGRDRFFEVLRKHGLLVQRKRGGVRTTQSRHALPVFSNLVAERETTAANQIWVSDLTYIRTEEGFVFGSVIMDRHTRMIVGSHVGYTLEREGCIAALEAALASLPEDRFPIHHSDRGCQYCSHDYVKRLKARDLSISMTQEHHCAENAFAERVIGTLKQEYELDSTFRTRQQAVEAFKQAVHLYNYRRLHQSLGYRTPAEVHARTAA